MSETICEHMDLIYEKSRRIGFREGIKYAREQINKMYHSLSEVENELFLSGDDFKIGQKTALENIDTILAEKEKSE